MHSKFFLFSCRGGPERNDNSSQKQKRSAIPLYNPFGEEHKADLQPSVKVLHIALRNVRYNCQIEQLITVSKYLKMVNSWISICIHAWEYENCTWNWEMNVWMLLQWHMATGDTVRFCCVSHDVGEGRKSWIWVRWDCWVRKMPLKSCCEEQWVLSLNIVLFSSWQILPLTSKQNSCAICFRKKAKWCARAAQQ